MQIMLESNWILLLHVKNKFTDRTIQQKRKKCKTKFIKFARAITGAGSKQTSLKVRIFIFWIRVNILWLAHLCNRYKPSLQKSFRINMRIEQNGFLWTSCTFSYHPSHNSNSNNKCTHVQTNTKPSQKNLHPNIKPCIQ